MFFLLPCLLEERKSPLRRNFQRAKKVFDGLQFWRIFLRFFLLLLVKMANLSTENIRRVVVNILKLGQQQR